MDDFDFDLGLDDTAPAPANGIAYPGNLEGDTKAEVTAVQQGFRDRMKAENDRRESATDSEYWCCLCFSNRAQVIAFVQAFGLDPEAKYIDGREIAGLLKITLPPNSPTPKAPRIDKTWADLAVNLTK